MRKHTTILAIASVLAVGAAATLYVQDSHHDGMMGRGGMMGMMGMMRQMSQMMDHCNQMMSGNSSGRPNEQWRKEAPTSPQTQ
jgi:hypothetical protein